MTLPVSGGERPCIGDFVKFSWTGGALDGTLWQGQIIDIRPAPQGVGEWMPTDTGGYVRFEPAYAPGTRLAYVASLGWPELHVLDVDAAGFNVKRDGVWRAA